MIKIISEKTVEVKWHNFTRDHYESLGYENYKFAKPFTVDINDVSEGTSSIYITVSCDSCGKTKRIRFNSYINSIKNNNLNFGEWNCLTCISRANKGCTDEEFRSKLLDVHGNDYDVIGKYVNNRTNIEIKHNACGYVWFVNIGNLLNTKPCPLCSKKVKDKNTEYFKKELFNLYEDDMRIIGEYTGSKEKIEIEHRKCGRLIFQTPNSLLRGIIGCGCNNSKGENKILEILNEKSVKCENQYRLEECRDAKRLPFDFAIFNDNGSLSYLVEYDGKHHFEPVNFGGISDKTAILNYKKTKNHDNIKDEYCYINGIKLIRIPYWDFDRIEEILDFHLNKSII